MGQQLALPFDGEKINGNICFVECPAGSGVKRYQGNGKLVLTNSGLYYIIVALRMLRIVEFPYTAISECTFSTSFSAPYIYVRHCTCCSCLPNGFVNIFAIVDGVQARVSISVVNAEIAVEKINNATRASTRQDFQSLILPINIPGQNRESTAGDKVLVIKGGKNLYCGKGTLYLTDKGVFYYASPAFEPSYRFVGVPYSRIRECSYTENFTAGNTNGEPSEVLADDGDIWASVINITGGKGKKTFRIVVAVDLAKSFVQKIKHSMNNK